jgi:hypothetical protein
VSIAARFRPTNGSESRGWIKTRDSSRNRLSTDRESSLSSEPRASSHSRIASFDVSWITISAPRGSDAHKVSSIKESCTRYDYALRTEERSSRAVLIVRRFCSFHVKVTPARSVRLCNRTTFHKYGSYENILSYRHYSDIGERIMAFSVSVSEFSSRMLVGENISCCCC